MIPLGKLNPLAAERKRLLLVVRMRLGCSSENGEGFCAFICQGTIILVILLILSEGGGRL